MAVTAPTAPVKPTPPVMPSAAQATSGNDGAPADAAAAAQAPNPDFVNAVKQVEAISAALQGQGKSGNTAPAAANTVSPTNAAASQGNDAKAATAAKPQTTIPAAASTAGTDESSAAQQTSTTAATPAKPAQQPASISYMPFVSIIVIVAVVLTAMKFLKQGQKKMPQKNSQRGRVKREPSLDIEALPDEKIKQKKSHFEVRI